MIAILAILAASVGGLLAYAKTRPTAFRVARSTRIDASPDAIRPLVADFRRWTAWSPYENIDPALKRTYGGAPSGTGAVYAWEGNAKVGTGRMEITGDEPSKVTLKLDFMKPFEASNVAEFTFTPSGDGTDVTWAMSGEYNFMSKLMGIFVDMDRLVGKDFEAGLANLKSTLESA